MRILVVEDEYKIGQALKKGLSQEGYAVDLESDGDSGLQSATTGHYDLLILDRMLPGQFDGVQIARSMRASNIDVPILMLTAKDAISDRVEGLDSGANDYLVKPFAFDELLARVRALLRKTTPHKTSNIKYADLTLDTKNKVAVRGGKTIDLTAKEYALLSYFMHNPEMVISKDQLIEHVWDFDADILPNNVEAYVGYLRSKIEQPFKDSPKLIHTRRGFGYMFSLENR